MIATAVILSLSAFASLRETAAIKGMEEFFSRRRQGAKKVSVSERWSLSPSLSDLASLRETSPGQIRFCHAKAPRRKEESKAAAALTSVLSHQERKKILVPAIRGVSPVTINNRPSTISFHPWHA